MVVRGSSCFGGQTPHTIDLFRLSPSNRGSRLLGPGLAAVGALIACLAAPPAAAAQVALSLGDLEDGASVTVEFDVTVEQPVTPGASQVCNQGTVSGLNFLPPLLTDDPAAGGAADPTCTPLLIPVDLVVSKTESADPVVAGSGPGNLTYVVTVQNDSLEFATGVALSESLTLPAGVAVVSITPSQGTFAAPTWSVGTLAPAGFATLTVVLTVDATAASGSDAVCDSAAVTAVNESDADPSDDDATECTSIARQVDLVVSKTESADPVVAGSGPGNLTYVVTVENAGPSNASGISLTEVLSLPAGVSLDSVTPSQGSFAAPNWSVGDLVVNASATLTVVVTVGPSAATGIDTLCDTATVTGANEALINPADDTATECTSVERQVDLVVSKTESADPVVAGDGPGNLTYVVTVESAGPSDASGVTLSEVLTLPAGVTLVSVTPSQGSFSSPSWAVGDLPRSSAATLTVVLTAGPSAAAGSDVICDTATVTGANEILIATGDDSATECTSVSRLVDLQVSKSESADPVIAGSGPGNLTYVVTVANAGPSNASGIALSEVLTLPAGVTVGSVTPSQGSFSAPTWSVGALAAGSGATLTVVLTVDASAASGSDVICDTASVTAVAEPQSSTANDTATECTSIARSADLAITKEDDADPPAPGDPLTWTLTVENLGPSQATAVAVTDNLPAGVTLVATSGCSEDPNGVPLCTLGSLAAGASSAYTIEVTINPSPPALLSNTATVSSAVFDANSSNNSDTETTTLDAVAPKVLEVATTPATAGGTLVDCETTGVAIEAFHILFDEDMFNPAGNTTFGDVTNPASYQLIQPGPDLAFDTLSCGGAAGDDLAVPLSAGSVTYQPGTHTATVTLAAPLADSLYRLFACASLRDPAGNRLDGNGDGNGDDDFQRHFRVDIANRFANGHFDCDLGGWTQSATAGATLEYDEDDAEASPESGSALGTVPFATASPEGVRLSQCVAAPEGHDLDFSARFRVTSGPTSPVTVSLTCAFYPAQACAGAVIETKSLIQAVLGSVPTWQPLLFHAGASAGSVSARCALRFDAQAGVTFEGRIDRAILLGPDLIFSDGFESGDTSAWSATVGGLK